MDLLRQRLDLTFRAELDRGCNAAAAGRRAHLGVTVLAFEPARLLQRGGQPQDLGGVERGVHSRRHVVPDGPSSNTIPSAFNSSRMRSAVAKSRLALAWARSAIRRPIDSLV